jgi:hypothetical protein
MDGEQNTGKSSAERSNRFRWPWPDIIMRIIIWLLLGIAINIFPPVIAYIVGAGDAGSNYSPLTVVLSSGDLLIATTAILPPALADLAISARRARRARTIIVIFGALVSLASLMIYCFAFINYLSQEQHQSAVAKHLSPEVVAKLSVGFFLLAVVLGSVCTGFLAAVDEQDSDERSESGA